ncbi:hypothetical protein ABTZ44_14015 [Microbacterium oxydans]|uniref:hypothetical protein n=1 Tax=Microbacterium TaxID=33882 RepID=UPI001D1168CB|nr:hypothetical protein [Microbacterium sp. R1]
MSARSQPISWFIQDPARLQRDKDEVGVFAPDLTFVEPGAELEDGGWAGTLPLWPFDRERPTGLDDVVPRGLEIVVEYTAAYPMVPPKVHPISPRPEIYERSQSDWHVLPSGPLCLFQSTGQWRPEASLTELLLKAAGWNLEYFLMKAELIPRMTESGIVSSAELDPLLSGAA